MVVILPNGQTQGDLADPSLEFSPLDHMATFSESFCSMEISSAKSYITAEFGQNLFPDTGLFVVGKQ